MSRAAAAPLAILIALAFPAAASADLFAAVMVRGTTASSGDGDIAVLNVATGSKRALPAGINTPAEESHPSISADGRRLTFDRYDPAAGTSRVIVADLATGQLSDLFTGFEEAQHESVQPTITSDGSTVFTGERFTNTSAGPAPSFGITSLAPFPAGPYSHSSQVAQEDAGAAAGGDTFEIASSGDLVAYVARPSSDDANALVLTRLHGPATPLRKSSGSDLDHPAMAATNPSIVLFAEQRILSGQRLQGDISFIPADMSTFASAAPVRLPTIVDSPADESQPAITADGRYVEFVRHGADSHDRLFAWDSQTQTLLNTAGVDLGVENGGVRGNVSPYTTPLLILASSIPRIGTAEFQLAQVAGVGIIVQRIKGRTHVLGKRAFKLGKPRRIPLGRFRKGRHTVHWKVPGRPLKPGRYLVTARAVTPQLAVRELGKPHVIRVRR